MSRTVKNIERSIWIGAVVGSLVLINVLGRGNI